MQVACNYADKQKIINLVRQIDKTLPFEVNTVCFTIDQLMILSKLVIEDYESQTHSTNGIKEL